MGQCRVSEALVKINFSPVLGTLRRFLLKSGNDECLNYPRFIYTFSDMSNVIDVNPFPTSWRRIHDNYHTFRVFAQA